MLKRKRISSILLALVMLFSVMVALPKQASAATDYSDVKEDDTFAPHIAYVTEKNAFQGEDGKFMPGASITRGQVAAVLARAKGLTLDEASNFSDVKADHTFTKEIAAVVKAKIFDGEKDGTFKPEEFITRGQAAKVIANAFGCDLVAGEALEFEDVKEGHTFKSYIDILTSNGVLSGDNGKFNPDSDVTRGQFAKYLAVPLGYVEPVDEFKVLSVSAINGREMKITFSKPVKESTVITLPGTTETLKTANLDVSPLTGAKTVTAIAAELSEDGKTLSLTAGSNYFDGKYAVVVQPTVTDLEGNPIEAYSEIVTIKDTVRPTVEKVEYTDFQTAKVTFTEPLKLLGTTTTSLSDITVNALATDGKSVTIDLSNTNVELNKDYTVTMVGAEDFAGNLISPNPTVITVKKVKADNIKPTVEAVNVVNATQFTVKFSEKLTATPSTFTLGAEALTVAVDATDKTLYNVTSTTATARVATLTIDGYTDLSGNAGDAYSKVLVFEIDKVDPVVQNTRVEKISGVEHLIITFNENVVAQDSVAINGKFIKDFVETTQTPVITTATATNFEHYKPVANKSKSVQLDISSLASGDYEVTLPVGLVKDATGNDNKAKANVKFTRTSDTDETKPGLVAAYDGNGIQVDDNTTVTVKFDKKLDVASALNVNNYSIEGVTVKSAIFTANTDSSGHAIVRLKLEDGSIALTGSRTVTIKNVKSADGVVMDAVTTSESFNENIKPTVVSAVLTDTDEITVTFSEKVSLGSGTPTAFDVFVGTETTKRTLTSETLSSIDGKSVVIKVGTAFVADDLAKAIVVKKASTNIVKDDPAGNLLDFTSVTVAK